MSDYQREISRRVEAFVADLTELVRQSAFAAVTEALESAGAASGGRRGGAAKARAAVGTGRRKGQKRSPASIARTTNALLAHIKKHPGQRIEPIGKAMRTATKDLTLPIKKLLKGKKITSKGDRRATTYFPA